LTVKFTAASRKEIAYRAALNITPENILNDVINTSLMIASLGKTFDPKGDYLHITAGLHPTKILHIQRGIS